MCFVFCKQRPAYGKRISDWSSDVCSSDLRPRGRAEASRRRMRLSTIKLSGFKSFVDPTTLHLPTNMTGVVGPTGCGTSNIIDAVRWVMGESTASRMRGDPLTDGNLSAPAARQPVTTATDELSLNKPAHPNAH